MSVTLHGTQSGTSERFQGSVILRQQIGFVPGHLSKVGEADEKISITDWARKLY